MWPQLVETGERPTTDSRQIGQLISGRSEFRIITEMKLVCSLGDWEELVSWLSSKLGFVSAGFLFRFRPEFVLAVASCLDWTFGPSCITITSFGWNSTRVSGNSWEHKSIVSYTSKPMSGMSMTSSLVFASVLVRPLTLVAIITFVCWSSVDRRSKSWLNCQQSLMISIVESKTKNFK